jgi:phosphoglycerate dehydrogenase-like enzyme
MTKDHLLIIEVEPEGYKQRIQKAIPDLEIETYEPPEPPPLDFIKEATIFLAWRFPHEILKEASQLKWIQSSGAGVDHILPSKYLPDEVIITRTGGLLGPYIAEYVIGYLLAIQLQMPRVLTNQRKAVWDQFNSDPLRGSVLGILGVGEIGSEIGKKAKAMGLTVYGIDPDEREREFLDQLVPPEQMDSILGKLDFLVLSVPLTPETRQLIGFQEFKLMKSEAYLINVARGDIVKEGELIQALEQGEIKGAVLDVFQTEPLPKDSKFWRMKNVIVTPHNAAPYPVDLIAEHFIENYRRFENGQPLMHIVDIKRGF